jgi:nucleoside-diphosphate-sugar epimerase
MNVFLTGGTGFLGSEVARRLRARGDDVTALVRNPDRARPLAEMGCRLVAGDLGDASAIRSGMQGCDAVIHGAAIYEVGIPASRRPAMYDANVRGTETVLEAAEVLEIPKAVHVSTIAAFGNTRGQVVDETHQHDRRYTSYYDETKHLAHELARGFAARGLPCVIAQPGQLYGPGDHSEVGATIHRFVRGRLPMLPFPELGMNFVHRDDAAAGIILTLDRGTPGDQYPLGGELTTMRGLIETLARITGRKAPRRAVHVVLLRLLAPLGPLAARSLGLPPNLREVITSAHDVTFWARDDKARKELGYSPRPLEQGLRDTLVAEGLLGEAEGSS